MSERSTSELRPAPGSTEHTQSSVRGVSLSGKCPSSDLILYVGICFCFVCVFFLVFSQTNFMDSLSSF